MLETQVDKADSVGVEGVDAELRSRILRFLHTRGIRGLDNVLIEVNGGKVILRGRSATARDRWLCVNSSQRVAGVLNVVDEIEDDRSCTDVRRPR